MKKGNVIETGVKGGAVKGSSTQRRVANVAPPVLKAAAREKADANVDPAEQKYLTVRQVALRWGSSGSTVRRLIEEGKLNGIRLRHACRLSLTSVDAYEESAHF